MKPTVSALEDVAPEGLAVEVVERKGLGHPDSLCDALVENLSVVLSRYYLERFGSILHHNVDKGLLYGGSARPCLGGGEVLAPMRIYLAGRATRDYRGVRVPVDEIAIEESRAWLARNLRHLDVARHVEILPLIRPTSPDLAELYARAQRTGTVCANDTSIGVGYAPLDALERAVLAAERTLTAVQTRRANPALGEDVKVMGVRRGGELRLTVACAMVGRHVADAAEYIACKQKARRLAGAAAAEAAGMPCEVEVNAADGEVTESLYVTVTGLSAEGGDDGEVGRGNRVNGLITPCRPMSLEAAAGKNPVSHVGKLYNIAAERIARAVTGRVSGVREVQCLLVSRIGHPIAQPKVFELRLRPEPSVRLGAVAEAAVAVAEEQFGQVGELWRDFVSGTVTVL